MQRKITPIESLLVDARKFAEKKPHLQLREKILKLKHDLYMQHLQMQLWEAFVKSSKTHQERMSALEFYEILREQANRMSKQLEEIKKLHLIKNPEAKLEPMPVVFLPPLAKAKTKQPVAKKAAPSLQTLEADWNNRDKEWKKMQR